MPKFVNLVEGLNILVKHAHSDTDYAQAEHDELYLPGPSPDKLQKEEIDKLNELGFHWDDHNDSWHVFT